MQLFFRELPNDNADHTVVILHGLFAASDNLLRLGKDLSEHFRVHLVDLRNHGKSPHSDTMTYVEMASDVIAHLDHHGIEHAAVVGHSMGGKVAMQCALDYAERILAVVVADIAPVSYDPSHNAIFNGLKYLLGHPVESRTQADEILSEHIDDWSVRQFLIKNLERDPAGGKALKWRFNLSAIDQNYKEILAAPDGQAFEGSVLFIAGEKSDYILPEHKQDTIKLFPKAQLKVIPDTTHWLHAQKPEVFNAQCLKFLKQTLA